MSGLPSGWGTATIEELASNEPAAITDGPFGSALKRSHYTEAGARVVRLGNLGEGSFIDDDKAFVPMDHYETLQRHKVLAGDVLVAALGEPLGRACRAPTHLGPAIVKADCFRVRPHEAVSASLLVHWLNSPRLREDILGSSHGLGRIRINLSDLKSLRVPIPPETEQRRIVAKIDSLSCRSARARHELDLVPKLIERYKQAILAKAFSGELTADWREKNDAKDWQPVIIEDIADSIFDGPFGSHLKSDDYVSAGVRVVRLENIGHLAFKGDKKTFISQQKYDQLRRHSLLPDDVIFSSFVDEEVRVCLFPGDLDTPAINKADCFCIRPNKEACEPKWLAMRLASRSTYETLRDAVHGATRPRINLGTLKSFSFDLPSPREQREMVRRIEHAFSWLKRITSEHARAEALLPKLDQAILAKAFRGELVPQNPNDEPASVLLERIKAERDGAEQPRRRRRSVAE